MVLMEVVEIDGKEYLSNTGEHYTGKDEFYAHARRHGEIYSGRIWELYGEMSKMGRKTLEPVVQYEICSVASQK
jgi:hypothetical protein